MKQDGELRAILLQRGWLIVALCFEWNPAQAGGRLSLSAGGAQAPMGPLHQSGPLQELLAVPPGDSALA